MSRITRRAFLGATAAVPFISCRSSSAPAGVRVKEISYGYEDYTYRTPIKFGGTVLDRATILNVNCTIEAADGRFAKGFGSMPLSNVWAYPSKTMPYEKTLDALQALAERMAKITRAYPESGHPIDINWALEPEYLKAAAEVSKARNVTEPIPKLATLMTASPFDAAIHDAFGKLHARNCFLTYGPDLMVHDLSHYLGAEFKGEYLDRYVLRKAKARMPLYHLVGAVDPIVEADSTYYFPPSRQLTTSWVDRTPKDFTMNVKASEMMAR